MLVLIVDQKASRIHGDRVDELLAWLRTLPASERLVRPFERTAGDEVEALADNVEDALDVVLALVRTGAWSVGVGTGVVDEPIPGSVRAASGPAFIHARQAIERAKKNPHHIALTGPDPDTAPDAERVLCVLGSVVQRRTAEEWEIVDLLTQGFTEQEVAEKLRIEESTVRARLRSGLYHEELQARPLAIGLLALADS